MAAAAVAPASNGVGSPTYSAEREAWEISQYERIIELRDEIFAGTHPRLKLLYPDTIRDDAGDGVNGDEPIIHPKPSQFYQEPGSITLPEHAGQNLSATATNSRLPPRPPPSAHSLRNGNEAAAIDPIFLTKSDVLLRAETQQRRQRIERVLADKVKEKQAISKQKGFDQDFMPDFVVTDVLKRAQELVKPVKFANDRAANGNASVSDSFDENTFYSSQMDESTPETTDKPELPRKTAPTQNCKFFIRGDRCPYGDQCIYAHDPTMRRGGQGQKSQPAIVTRNNADTQAPPGPRNTEQQRTLNADSASKPVSQAERIAELEDQLRALRSEKADTSVGPSRINTRNAQQAHLEEAVYSPPDAVAPKPNEVALAKRKDLDEQQQRASALTEGSRREYPQRETAATSPVFNEGRIVRSHITSPVAPQPARVSPLAVAKAPAIAQRHRQQRHVNDPFHEAANGTSPAQSSGQQQVSNPRKRKKGRESGERTRNVVPRREVCSPNIHVKEEPLSPPPFSQPTETWHSRRRVEGRGPIYVDEVSPRYHAQEGGEYRSNVIDRPPPRYVLDDYRVPQPSTYEPDLRRIVSTSQARASLAGNERYPSPHPHPAHAVSHVYVPRQEQEMPRQYRGSMQPEAVTYRERELPPSPRFRDEAIMAPPPRRIVVDQHGNQFYEQEATPMPRPRQSSAAPSFRRGPPEVTFESPAPRQSIARIPHPVDDKGSYIRRGPFSPQPRFVEYLSPTDNRVPVDRDMGMYYGNEFQPRRADGVRVLDYPAAHANGAYEDMRAIEGISRVSSVRPYSYEGGPERVPRVQSVHPEGRQVGGLGGNMIPQAIRMSVRPEESYMRPVEYVQPRTQYYSGPEGRG
ncbi:MAG: hypothetical protein L6R35_002290 [Caloplaca aegaea]|nr:MAG: hypothetical protein L6R35_002290 [Caloplaca aegaea]